MMDEARSYTRAELYELLGTTPATGLEQRFQMTSAAIAKRCRKLRIPMLGRGDWEKVRVGKPIDRAPLPIEGELGADTVAISAYDISRLAGLKARRVERQASRGGTTKRRRTKAPKQGAKRRALVDPTLSEAVRPPPPHEERPAVEYLFDVSGWSWEYENTRADLTRLTADDPDNPLEEFNDVVVRGELYHPPELASKVMVLFLTLGPSTHDREFANTDRPHVGAIEFAYDRVVGRARVSEAAAALLVRALDYGRPVHVNVTAEEGDFGGEQIMTTLRIEAPTLKSRA